MKKIRIIFDGEPLVASHFSGIGHYTLELLRAVDRQLENYPNVRTSMFVYAPLAAKARSYGLQHIKVLRSPYSQRIANGLKRRNKQPPLDLLFGKGTYVFTNFSSWPLLFSKNIPFIYDLSFEKYPQFAAPENQVFLSQQVRLAAQRADRIATISNSSKEEISAFYGMAHDKIGIYYPAVDQAFFSHRSSEEIARAKKSYGIDGKYILFVGNIEPRKNLINLLLAYEALPEATRRSYKLLLVGAKGWQDGEITQAIERLNRQKKHVLLPNKYVADADLPALFSGATAFVYPSVYEGFGIPPIEAMACGTPVVCANNSSLPEAVGKAAIMVDAGSVDSIRNGIETILKDPKLAASLVEKGYTHIKSFSWDVSARHLLDDIVALEEGQS